MEPREPRRVHQPELDSVPSISIQKEAFDTVQRNVNQLCEHFDMPVRSGGGLCIPTMLFTFAELTSLGYSCVFQLGDLSWPMVARDKDDGVSATHFSYVWSPNTPASQARIVEGGVPELHAWVAIKKDPIAIVDFSTNTLRTEAERAGFSWSAIDPPNWLWTSQLPDRVVYTPRIGALGFFFGWITSNDTLLEAIKNIDPFANARIQEELDMIAGAKYQYEQRMREQAEREAKEASG